MILYKLGGGYVFSKHVYLTELTVKRARAKRGYLGSLVVHIYL